LTFSTTSSAGAKARPDLLGGAGLLHQFVLHLEDGLDALLVAELDGGAARRRRDLGRADLDHVDAVAVAREHQVQIGELHLGLRGIEHELLAVVGFDAADADGRHGPSKGRR
jgi:hypothetical protein